MSKFTNKQKTTRDRDRHAQLLELGVEHAAPWKAHPALRYVVTRETVDGQQLRVSFLYEADRNRFLQDQAVLLEEIRNNPESRKNLDREL